MLKGVGRLRAQVLPGAMASRIYAGARSARAPVVALGIGMMALLVLDGSCATTSGHLADEPPAAAPNRFIINIQRSRWEPLRAFFTAARRA